MPDAKSPFRSASEQRADVRIGDAASRSVRVQLALMRALQHVALGAIVEDYPEARVAAALIIREERWRRRLQSPR